MADENGSNIDTDSMSMDEISALRGKMEAGEPVQQQEPEPQQQPEPETQAIDDDAAVAEAEATPEQERGSKFVPHKTFNHANERRKAAEKERDEFRERYARLEERTNLLLAQQQPAQPTPTAEPEAPSIPDPNTNPLEAIAWVQEQLKQQNDAKAEQQKRETEQQREQQAFNQAYERVNSDYQATAQADPSFVEAHNALRKSLGEELLAMGYTQNQALQQIAATENQHLMHIAANGLKVGDYVKALARSRGWTGTPQPQPTPAAQPDPAAAQAALEAARQAGASLGSSGGAVANTGRITVQQLADMPEAEFRAYMEKNGNTRGAFEQA